MAYGTLKCDNITFTNGGVDQTVTVSGIVQSISGNITATGTIQGATIIGTSTVSGATVTGDAGQFITATAATGVFTSTLSGATITGNTASFTTITGGTVTLTSGVFASGTAAAPSVSVGTTDNGLYSPGADQVAISSNGVGRLFIDASGNVGVGVSPSVSFHVNGRIRLGDANRLDWGNGNEYIVGDNGGAMLFGIASSERMRLDSSGRLGLGTSAPWSTFTVGSGGTANPAATATIHQNTHSEYRLKLTSSTYNADGNWLGLGFGYSDNYLKAGIIAEAKDGNARTNLHFCLDGNANSDNAGLGDSKMVITYGGNVGIGDTGPSAKLSVVGSAGSTLAAFTTPGVATVYIGISGQSENYYDANTQIFRAGNSSTERMRIDSSGRFLVGTSSSFSAGASAQYGKLQIVGNSFSASTQAILSLGRGQASGGSITTGSAIGTVVFSDSSGGEFAQIACEADAATGTNDYPGRLVFSTTPDGASSPTERMRISSAGLVAINTTTKYDGNAVSLAVAGAFPATPVEIQQNTTGTHYAITFRNANGLVGNIATSGSATAFNTSSDYRLKENIVPLTGAADRLNQLQVHRFNFIADPGKTVDGFIAHEAQAVVPECVTGTKDAVDTDGNPVYQGIDQSKLVPLLTAALQEALAKIEVLEQRLTDAGIA